MNRSVLTIKKVTVMSMNTTITAGNSCTRHRDPANFCRRITVLLSVLVCSVTVSYGEEKCDLLFNDCPEYVHKKTITVGSHIVALASKAYVCQAERVIEHVNQGSGPSSIVFVIDHSYSMQGLCNTYPGNDTWGARFLTVRNLLDTIYKKQPLTEVGLVIFREVLYFDKRSDPLFCPLPNHGDQAYIPLMRLNASLSNGKTAIAYLKDILTTDTITAKNLQLNIPVTCADLRYKPLFQTVGNTNINVAFGAARHALIRAAYPKMNQYIVFLSDGEPHPLDPAWQDGKDPFDFVKGEQVPATFTVFFNASNQPPKSLQEMTVHIQNNGYSKTNVISKLWALKADYATLMKLLHEQVISKLLEVITTVPKAMTINNRTSTLYGNNFFHFPDRFPLNPLQTAFSADIVYTITNKNTGVTYDTATHTEFTIQRAPGTAIPPEFTQQCWDRTLSILYRGGPVSAVNEMMKELSLRFTFDPGAAQYRYTAVSIELSTVRQPNERECVVLDKNGNEFGKNFSHAIGPAAPMDGIVQVQPFDTIVAIFRNPGLPCDTLRIGVPFVITNRIELNHAGYFDRDADGYVDSIFIASAGVPKAEDLKEFLAAITLPPFRNYTVHAARVCTTGVSLLVAEKHDHLPITMVTAKDSIYAGTIALTHGGWVMPRRIGIIDYMGPVILRAHLRDFDIDSITDTLIVRYSEPIQSITFDKPCRMKQSRTGTPYTVQLKPAPFGGCIVRFAVHQIIGEGPVAVSGMESNDSVWINTAAVNGKVYDTVGNMQGNPINRRVPLEVEYVSIPVQFIVKAQTPYEPKKDNPVPQFLLTLPDIGREKLDHKNGSVQGLVIACVPATPQLIHPKEQFTGTISIIDPLGNRIIERKKMAYYDGNGSGGARGLYFVYNCRTAYGRAIGNGSYMVLIRVDRYDRSGRLSATEICKTMIGVKG